MIWLDADLRPLGREGPEGITRLGAETGADGVTLTGGGVTLGDVEATLPVAFASGAPLQAIAAPLAERPLAPGRRLPRLSAQDPEERLAAVGLIDNLSARVTPIGVRLFTVCLGAVPLATRSDAFLREVRRRAIEDDESHAGPGPALREAAVNERRTLSRGLLDSARFAFERLLPIAERRGLTLGLDIAATPWEFPSAREALLLLDEYRGAPLGVCFDRGRLALLRYLGFGGEGDRLRALAAHAVVVRATESVGSEPGFLPGLGEPDAMVAGIEVPAGTPTIVSGGADATLAEIHQAMATLRAASSQATGQAAEASTPG